MLNSDEIKLSMLNQFDIELDEIFNLYDHEQISLKQLINKLNLFKYVWGRNRLDIKNFGKKFNDIQFLSDDENSYITSPKWLNNEEGHGYKIESDYDQSISIKCINKGILKIFLRGLDFKLLNKRKPIYVNFVKLLVNDEEVFNENNLLWHDKSFVYEKVCEDNEEVNIEIEVKNIFDYFPQIKTDFRQINSVKDIVSVKKLHNLIKEYLAYEQSLKNNIGGNSVGIELYDFYKSNNLINEYNEELFSSYDTFQESYSDFNKNKLVEANQIINDLNSRIDTLENKILRLEDVMNSYAESDNLLFNTIFIDHRLQPSTLLNYLQTLCSELLLFVSNICKKHEINWWLDYGTLLGSIRHEGFIPWDDDLDIGMMRKDYHRFIDVMYDEIKEHKLDDIIEVAYRYRKYGNIQVNSFIQFFVKDLKHGNKEIMAGLDVFPYDYLKEYNKSTFGRLYNQAKTNFYKRLTQGSKTASVYMGLEYDEVINEYFNKLNLSYDEEKYVIPGVEGAFGYKGANIYELSVLLHDEIFPLKENKFREYTFPIPNNYDSFLTKFYGEYTKVPKLVRAHGRLDDFKNMPNIDKTFEIFIEKFKKANENF